jgi:hypothetical protein
MMQLFLIGLAAGVASALLVTSAFSRSPFALLLVSFAPLPILIAAIGWNYLAGLIAAVVAAAAALAAIVVVTKIGAVIDFNFAFHFIAAFLVTMGLPVWWLGYLALLARPGAQPGETEWYPVGRLVVWTAVFGAAVVTLAIVNFTTDVEVYRSALRRAFEEFLRLRMRTPANAPLQLPGVPDSGWFIEMFVHLFAPTMALLSMLNSLFNLWLAGAIVRMSGRLQRPWPDIAALRLPPLVAGGFAAAIVGSLTPGIVGLVAGLLATTLLMSYAVLGFAIIHKITEGVNVRGLILTGIYVAVAILGWPVFVMVLLGLADGVIDIRERVASMRGPPAPHT